MIWKKLYHEAMLLVPSKLKKFCIFNKKLNFAFAFKVVNKNLPKSYNSNLNHTCSMSTRYSNIFMKMMAVHTETRNTTVVARMKKNSLNTTLLSTGLISNLNAPLCSRVIRNKEKLLWLLLISPERSLSMILIYTSPSSSSTTLGLPITDTYQHQDISRMNYCWSLSADSEKENKCRRSLNPD